MKVITFASQKGGTGKSTLAINLSIACNLSHPGKVVAIADTDPQGTSFEWNGYRPEAYSYPLCSLVDQGESFRSTAQKARSAGVDYLFVDTAGSHHPNTIGYARASDIIIVPVRPQAFDLWAINRSLESFGDQNVLFALNSVLAPRGATESVSVRNTRRDLEKSGYKVARQAIVEREVFNEAHREGLSVLEYSPGSYASVEIKRLWREIDISIHNNAKS